MTILVQCPHCETRFNLQPDMAGKSMRCPNLECRQAFIAKPAPPPTEPPAPTPATVAPPPKRAVPAPPPLKLPPNPAGLPPDPGEVAARKPRKPEKPAVVDAEIVEAAVVSTPKVKEVVWSAGTDVPPAKGKKPVRAAAVVESGPDLPIVRRKKKRRNLGPLILIGMVVAIIMVGMFAGLYAVRMKEGEELLLAQQAEEQYKKADYPAAEKAFTKLAGDYPDSERLPEYQFFADLSALQVAVKVVTNRDNPEPVVGKLKAFVEKQKDSTFAKPGTGFGHDIYEAGRKLGEDVAAHADDRVQAYKADRGKSGELDRATKAVALGRDLAPLLDPFRGDARPLDEVRKRLDQAEADVRWEHARTAALAKAAGQLQQLSDASIQAAEADLRASGFLAEPEAQAMIAAAKGRLREQVRFEPDAAVPEAPPPSAAATLLFVSPVGPTRPPKPADDGLQPSVFLLVASGILYALDEGGNFLWALRVGADVTDPPTVVRVDLGEGPADVALVTSNVGGKPALGAYSVRTGAPVWYQPLTVPGSRGEARVPAPAAGPAAVVGARVFVALRDPEGSVYEFDLKTGARQGRIPLRQPAGPGLATRPGTGLVYAAADARRVYVIDTGGILDAGRIDPVCVQVIATNHPAGTLRTPPLLLGPEGDATAERWMVLVQADGPASTRVRAFPVRPTSAPVAGTLPPETPEPPAVDLAIPGWVWFPPVSDGEHLALATDSGQFRLFGINQPGNSDPALFAYNAPNLPAPAEGTVIPGLAWPAEEAAYWVVANGEVQKFRLALVPKGLEAVPVGPRTALGVPVQPPQWNARKDAVCLVVRSPNSAGCKAVLIGQRDGEVRWQRQLGVLPAGPPIPQEGGTLLAAEDGTLVVIPADSGAAPGQTVVAPPGWVIASAPDNVTHPAAVAVSADGKTAFTVTPVLAAGGRESVAKYLIRRVEGGKVVHEGSVNAPGTIAGRPVVLGDALLIPASDGYVYRHAPGTGLRNPDALTAGPSWGDRRSADAACSITPLSDTTFLTGDGGKRLAAWSWPKGAGHRSAGGNWELRERPAGPGVVLPGDTPRLLIADVTGSVWLYADRGGQPLRRWQPGTGIPPGRPSSPLVVQTDAAGKPVVAYTVENKFVVCIDPDRESPRWAVRVGEEADGTTVGAPQPAGAGRWLVTDLVGRMTVLSGDGDRVGSVAVALPGAVPGAAASVTGGGILAPLSDGSAVVLSLPGLPAAAPEPKPKE